MPHIFHAANSSLRWSWITLAGRDARDFLHRLTTVNVSALGEGEGAPGCFLNAQGKIRAVFHLWRYGNEDFAFELEAGADGNWSRELLAAIEQYTFAEKFQLADATPNLDVWWILADLNEEKSVLEKLGAPSLLAGKTVAIDEEIRICHRGSADFGRVWITAWGRPQRIQQWIERVLPGSASVSMTELESWRIQALRPRVGAEITSSTIPLEAGLVDTIAQGKGCYPGQEVIERIVSLGSPARRLVRIDGNGTLPQVGDLLTNLAEPPVEVGQITSVTQVDQGVVALAYVRKIHAQEGLEIRIGSAAAGNFQGQITRVAPYA